ncbi:mechanosensitive ion channel family protein [Actinospica sp. MGRD01-02]|uniref:Mechanosensitive ion channel family protein n=1 Tax=Actinospica acidithermotolerans TaxID=2828514 RepID=A0A941IQ17_9ACTN|nr:mechanosensitive ion channel family protein [Actinospica acidithermotolerans]MBR7830981.1 mechanosensitive ion channel family protein [Actinospica acidithermotolerans]
MSAIAAAASSTPTPSVTPTAVTTHDVQTWVDAHGSLLLNNGLKILGIILVCVLLRKFIARTINKVVRHAAQVAESRAGRMLEGSGLVATERARQRTQAIGSVLRSVSSTVIFSVGTLMIISVLQISITPLLASVSAVGVAVGLGAKDVITDFLAGITMIFEDQYGVGDVIDTGLASGTVIEVGLRVTKLRDVDGQIWYVRNGSISRVGNKSQGWGRAVVDVPVGYGADLGRVQEVLSVMAEEMYADKDWRPKFLDEQPPQVLGIENLDGGAVVIRVQARTAPQKNFEVTRELRHRIKLALDTAGIEVASVAA